MNNSCVSINSEKLPGAAENLKHMSLNNSKTCLAFPQEELHERPQITSMIGSLANYSNTIPSAPEGADGDAKPPPPSARMGKFLVHPNIRCETSSPRNHNRLTEQRAI